MKIVGGDVYTAIGIDKTEQLFQSGPNEGKPYFRARFDGKGFIVTPEFLKDWQSGAIVEVNLTESSYEVEDPMDPEKMITRQSWQLTAYGTIDQLEAVERNSNRLNKVRKMGEIDLQKLEVDALGELKLSDEMIAKLKAAL